MTCPGCGLSRPGRAAIVGGLLLILAGGYLARDGPAALVAARPSRSGSASS